MSGPFTTPNPLQYGLGLPVDARRALRTAYPSRHGYSVRPELHEILNRYSLVDCRLPILSAFGTNVLRALIRGAEQ